jgi:anhydro-N-acetylmuramic acid kinase
VYDFADTDIKNGGNGAPLATTYYKALIHQSACRGLINEKQTIAVIYIGSMVNITILSQRGIPESFDSGPGNILINEYVQRSFQKSNDDNGDISGKGNVADKMVTEWISRDIFKSGKKFFCFSDFAYCLEQASRELVPVDCLATLTALTARTIIESIKKYNDLNTIVLIGPGSQNEFLKTLLNRSYNITSSEKLCWDSSFMESEQHAFCAVRSFFMLPSSFPSTTGVSKPVCCGRLTIPVSFCKKAEPGIAI